MELGFQSSSESFIRDNPRGYRLWKGSLDVEGADLKGIEGYFDNRFSEFARRDPQNPNRILFSDDTRGRADTLILDLDQVTPSTRFVIHLDPSMEHDVAPPQARPYAKIPAATVTLPFNETKEGLLIRDLPVDRYVDTIFLQLVNPKRPWMENSIMWIGLILSQGTTIMCASHNWTALTHGGHRSGWVASQPSKAEARCRATLAIASSWLKEWGYPYTMLLAAGTRVWYFPLSRLVGLFECWKGSARGTRSPTSQPGSSDRN